MSSRAVRALRGELGIPMIPHAVSEDSEGNSSEEDDPVARRPTAFALMHSDDDSDDESSSEQESANGEKVAESGSERSDGATEDHQRGKDALRKVEGQDPELDKKPRAIAVGEEDLDALLDEFREKYDIQPELGSDHGGDSATLESSAHHACPFDTILSNLNSRDLDYEYSMRTSLLNNLDDGGANETASTANASRRTQMRSKAPLFGPTRDGWTRPPRLVGGGMGMATYDRDPRVLPWPYRTISSTVPLSQWCTFVHSDSHRRDCDDYVHVIRQSADINALVMFVAHHPYVTTALLQLTTVLYQTNHMQQGMQLLQRTLWIYESSALVSFVQNLQQPQQHKRTFLMDCEQPENAPFFDSLFRLVHVSSIAGCVITSLIT